MEKKDQDGKEALEKTGAGRTCARQSGGVGIDLVQGDWKLGLSQHEQQLPLGACLHKRLFIH
jgi:hypothetical protein